MNLLNKDIFTGVIIGTATILVIQLILNQIRKKKCDNINQVIKILVRQAARWSTAAIQDENPLIALLHANYGAGYLWALSDVASTSQIKEATGIDYLKFKNEVVAAQDYATKKMSKICPKFAPKRSYLTKLGGE